MRIARVVGVVVGRAGQRMGPVMMRSMYRWMLGANASAHGPLACERFGVGALHVGIGHVGIDALARVHVGMRGHIGAGEWVH